MICTMDRSSGNLLGYSVSDDVTKADFGTLTPAVAAVVKEHGSVCLLLDVTKLHLEKANALGAEVSFGKQFQGKIDKMAIVADSKWEKAANELFKKLNVSDSRFFQTTDDAWTWLGA